MEDMNNEMQREEALKEITIQTIESLIEQGLGRKTAYRTNEKKYTYKRILSELKEESRIGKQFLEFIREDVEKITLKNYIIGEFEEATENGEGSNIVYKTDEADYTMVMMLNEIKEGSEIAYQYIDEIYEDEKNLPYKEKLIEFLKGLSADDLEAAKTIVIKVAGIQKDTAKDVYDIIEEDIYEYLALYTSLTGMHENMGLAAGLKMMGDIEDSPLFEVFFS